MKNPVLHNPFQKILILLVIVFFAFSSAPAETESPDPAPDLRGMLARATGELDGSYELLALTAEMYFETDEGEHTAYSLLCRITGIPDADPQLAAVVIDVTDQSAELMAAETWPVRSETGVAVPEPDYMLNMYFGGVADIPAGTAGSSLQAAGQVADIWLLCARIDFASLEPETVRNVLSSAMAGLSEESRILYDENAPGILAEARRLLDPQAELSGLCEDAGLADCLTVLRQEEAVRASVEAFLNLVE